MEFSPEKSSAAGGCVGLRGLALDLVAKGVLALVGVGQIGVVENQERSGEENAGEQQRQRQAVEADAAGLEGHDFVVLAEHAESDQGGDESGEGRELVDEIGNQETEIVDDDEKGNAGGGRCRREARRR